MADTSSNNAIRAVFDAGILNVTLNHPERRNCFAEHMRRDLAGVLDRAASDDRVRVVVLTGAGAAFCAGGDLRRMHELMNRDDGAEEFDRALGAGRRIVLGIRTMTKPVIAAISGAATGEGFNLALACDIRLASEDATFSESFVRFGLSPAWGGTYFLPRAVPANIACELFFLGDTIDAREALRLNLVNRVYATTELDTETRRLAERLRDAPPAAIAAAKHAVYASADSTLEGMLRYEHEAQMRTFRTADAREGVRAFVEKRQPRFAKR